MKINEKTGWALHDSRLVNLNVYLGVELYDYMKTWGITLVSPSGDNRTLFYSSEDLRNDTYKGLILYLTGEKWEAYKPEPPKECEHEWDKSVPGRHTCRKCYKKKTVEIQVEDHVKKIRKQVDDVLSNQDKAAPKKKRKRRTKEEMKEAQNNVEQSD